jgi:hypothetical protein
MTVVALGSAQGERFDDKPHRAHARRKPHASSRPRDLGASTRKPGPRAKQRWSKAERRTAR